jgi:hypothetical protein
MGDFWRLAVLRFFVLLCNRGFAMSTFVLPFQATDPDIYEHFMGRWSHRLAGPFLEFVGQIR